MTKIFLARSKETDKFNREERKLKLDARKLVRCNFLRRHYPEQVQGVLLSLAYAKRPHYAIAESRRNADSVETQL